MAQAQKSPATRKPAAQRKGASKGAAKPATPFSGLVAATPAKVAEKPATVALRGGPAVQSIALMEGAVYRTKAAHNLEWWAKLQAALKGGAKPVAPLLLTPANPAGVPAHFVGYCLRRGYLTAA